jgi:predicted phosphodiesterase
MAFIKPRKLNAEIAIEYIRKYPHLPSKSLARLLCDHEPALFSNVEYARGVVRTYRGIHGNHARSNVRLTAFYKAKGTQSDAVVPLPPVITEPDDWKVINIEFKNAVVLCDIHMPFYDKQALVAALDYAQDRKPDCVILLGDILDHYPVSFWERDPRLRQPLNDEIEAGRLFLEHLRARFPKSRIIFKEGNHEERLWRYAWKRAPELFTVLDPDGAPILRLDTMLDFKEYGVELVDNKQPIRCGPHLHLLHGHEFPSSFTNPVNPARGLFLRAQCNCAAGHLHQTSNHTESGLDKTVSTFGIGCLCHRRPRYRPLNKWNHGFAWIELNHTAWSFDNLKIVSGKVV